MRKNTTATPAEKIQSFEARLLTKNNREALARAGVAGQTPEEVLADIVVNLDVALPPEWEEYVRANALPEEHSVWLFRLGCRSKARSFTPGEIFAAATAPEAVVEIEAAPEWIRLTRKTA